jgi:imidazolonepropionase-like amidohydrolase
MHAIRAGVVFDGETPRPGGGLVLVDGDRVVGVERADAPVPDGCAVLDVPHGAVLPGLVDAHVHLCADSTDETLERLAEPDDAQLRDVITQSLQQHLAAGVTTVRDLGDRRYAVLDWRADPASGPHPTIVCAGPPITSVGGHCANMGGEVSGAEQLRAAVRERVERGVDVVKVMASGGFATMGTQVLQPQFTEDELRLVVDEAHRAGLPVTAHAHALPAVHQAMAVGVDGIEHCSFLTDQGVQQSDEDLARLAASGIAVCPTLGFVGTPVITPNGQALMDRLGVTFEQVLEAGRRRIAQMHAAGVRLVSGSDAGIGAGKPHGVLPTSVEFMVRGGVDPVAALASATSVGAQVCGLGDRKGRLRPGYDADLLVVDGDPTVDITALSRLVAVYVGGRGVASA